MAFWSTVATAFKLALAEMSFLHLLFWAVLSSTFGLALVLAWQRRLILAVKSLRQQWHKAALMGALNPLAYYCILFAAYERLPAQIAQPVNYTWAIVLALLAVPVLGQKLRWQDGIAMLLGYAGVVVISSGGGLAGQPLSWTGLGLAILSTFVWAGYWLLNTKDSRDPVVGLFQNFLLALPVVALIAWPINEINWAVATAVYVGLFEMGFTFVLWLYALKLTRHTSRIGNLIFVSPFVSLVLIHFVLGEPIRWVTLIGLVMIIIGLRIQHAKTSSQ